MARIEIVKQIAESWDNFKSLDIETIIKNTPNLTPWNNLTPEDFNDSVKDLKEIFEAVIEQNALEKYPWNILNSLLATLNNVFQQTQQFVNSRNQGTFQNSLQQIEALRTNLRSWGIDSYVKFGQNIENKIQGFDIEYQNIVKKGQEIDALKQSVENLIKPAVAGSLSLSFSERQKRLKSNKNIWLIITIVAGVVSIIATILVMLELIDVFTVNFPDNATQQQIQTIINKQPSFEGIQLIRVVILFPIFYLFGISFSQYKKERNLEEEYAHRSAVSSSLPNYGDLAGDPAVKDQIISSATQVVFTSPIAEDRHKRTKIKYENTLSDLKGLVESLTSFIKPNG